MNRKLMKAGLLMTLAALAAGAPPASAAVNLLANPGFETGGGSYTGWFTFGSGVQLSLPTPGDNIFRTGSAASKIYGGFVGCPGSPQFSVVGYGQAFTPTAGRVYEFSGYTFVSGADPIPGADVCNNNRLIAKIVYFNAASGGAEISSSEIPVGTFATAVNLWHSFTVSAPVPPGALRVEALMLYLQPACATGAVFVDDLSFCELTPDSEPNLLANPAFTSNLTGWSTFGNVYYDARSFLVRTPAGSAKLFSTFVLDSPSGLFQSFAAVPGSAWRLDAYALNTCREDPITGTNDSYLEARIVFRDLGGTEIGSAATVLVDNNSLLGAWTRRATQGIAPAGTVSVDAFILFISPTINPGDAAWVDDISFRMVDPTGTPEAPPATAFRLSQNTPNPFSASTRIDFDLARAASVDVSVFDVTGRRVATLLEDRLDAGPHSVSWNGATASGARAAAGIYHLVMRTPEGRLTRNMVLVD